MGEKEKPMTRRSSGAEVDSFLRKVASMPAVRPAGRRGRLIFAMDATASRQPTWDRAAHIQAEMFEETARLGGLEIQLCHFRGFREFECSPWTSDAAALQRRMTAVTCQAGHTQIERVLAHAVRETRAQPVQALVYVGDSMEEDLDALLRPAGELALLGLPAFIFHEGDDPVAARAFSTIARITRGACCNFDASSARQLRDLLSAVAVFAAGGRKALADLGRRNPTARRLTHQIDKG